ncbi:MAG: class I SAM-dependent methyltransferase [Elusimicrobia bacterium]|nr:class I SAM-dependent methyltransferase [Elusimicrobiota bacterium]
MLAMPEHCCVCDEPRWQPYWRGLRRCPRCTFVWAITEENYDQAQDIYHDPGYFFGGEYLDYVKERPYLAKGFRLRLDMLRRFASSGLLFEVGSAFGFFLEGAKKNFTVSGIDINAEACAYARSNFNLNVITGDLLKIDLPENHFDVIVSWATLEHLTQPHLYVKKISQLVKRGGIFACSTGDINSPLPLMQKGNWRLIHPPTHLSYFSRRSLAELMNRCGFKPVYSKWIGEHRSLDGMLHSYFVTLKKKPSIYEWFKRKGLNKGGFYLNTWDTIFMIGRRV